MTRRFLLAAAVALLGCAPRPADHFDLYVSQDIPCSWVQTAASAWEARTPVTFEVHCAMAACSGDCWSVSAATPGSLNAATGDARGDTVETGSPNRGYILVTVDEDADPVQEVALLEHELGHAMSLKHRPAATHDVMVADLGWWNVTCDDVAQWYEVRGETPPSCEDPACPPYLPGCAVPLEGRMMQAEDAMAEKKGTGKGKKSGATPETQKALDNFHAGFARAAVKDQAAIDKGEKVHDLSQGFLEDVDPKVADR